MSNYKDSSAFVRKLTTTKLDCGVSLRELTDHEGIRMWWFADFDLIDLLLHMPDGDRRYDPKELRFQSYLCRMPVWLFAGLNLCFDVLRKLFIKAAMALYAKKKHRQKPEEGVHKVLFTAQDMMWQQVKDHRTGQVRKTDIFFDSVIKVLEERNDIQLVGTYPCISYVYLVRKAIESLRILADKLKMWDIRHVPFNLYWNVGIWRKEYRAARYFLKQWKVLARDEKFRQLCMLGERDMYDLVSRQLKFYFLVLFPYALKRIALAHRLLEQERPELILLINEYGIFERALLIAGKQKHIATVALQHGNIHASHQGYMYQPEDISREGLVRSPYCPIPDKTAVFGEYFKDMLCGTSVYPEDSLVVTGSCRHDVIDTIKNDLSKEDVLSCYGIDHTKRTILWTTTCIAMIDEENIINFRAFRAAMDQLSDTILVIKMHPNSKDRYVRMAKEYLSMPRDNVVIVPKNADTLCLIHACDMMVTKMSTTAIEAVAMDKPLLILNLTGDADKMEYVSQNIAVGVYAAEDLAATIENLINDDAELAENRNRYVEQYFYKIDGRASRRVAGLIDDMLTGQR